MMIFKSKWLQMDCSSVIVHAPASHRWYVRCLIPKCFAICWLLTDRSRRLLRTISVITSILLEEFAILRQIYGTNITINLLISCNLFTFVSLERRNIILHFFCSGVIVCWLLSGVIGLGKVLID